MAGIFRWGILATDAFAQAEIGDKCYVEDDQTVRKSQNAGATHAGRVYAVDSQAVWVGTGITRL